MFDLLLSFLPDTTDALLHISRRGLEPAHCLDHLAFEGFVESVNVVVNVPGWYWRTENAAGGRVHFNNRKSAWKNQQSDR